MTYIILKTAGDVPAVWFVVQAGALRFRLLLDSGRQMLGFLHISAILAAYFVEGVCDLAEACYFYGFHQFGEDVAA